MYTKHIQTLLGSGDSDSKTYNFYRELVSSLIRVRNILSFRLAISTRYGRTQTARIFHFESVIVLIVGRVVTTFAGSVSIIL